MKTLDILKNTAFAAVVAGALALPATVQAEGWGKDKSANAGASTGVTQQNFAEADADKSGSLTESEYDTYADAQENADLDIASDFSDLDANKDKTLSVAEFIAQKADGKDVNDNQ